MKMTFNSASLAGYWWCCISNYDKLLTKKGKKIYALPPPPQKVYRRRSVSILFLQLAIWRYYFGHLFFSISCLCFGLFVGHILWRMEEFYLSPCVKHEYQRRHYRQSGASGNAFPTSKNTSEKFKSMGNKNLSGKQMFEFFWVSSGTNNKPAKVCVKEIVWLCA